MKTAINLLPLELRAVQRFPWRRLGQAAGTLVFAGGVAAAAWFAYGWYSAYNAELRAVREETARMKAVVRARDELVRVEAVIDRKQGFIDRTREARPLWRVLQALAETAPPGVTVSDFTLADPDALTAQGTAPSLTAVARFLRAMEGSGFYASPLVVFPQPFSAQDGKVKVPYKITARLGGG